MYTVHRDKTMNKPDMTHCISIDFSQQQINNKLSILYINKRIQSVYQ